MCVLQALDVASTIVGLAAGASEKNPVGNVLLAGGPWALVVAKIVGTATILCVAGMLYASGRSGRRWAQAAVNWCCVVMGAVVLWNGSVILGRLVT